MTETLNVLIVDDEEHIRHELGEFLNDNGYQVWYAGMPSAAFDILAITPIDLVFLDIRLPEMDGLEALTRIKSGWPETEVIMISGHGEMQTVIQAMRRGASDYFSKPFTHVEVMSAIERSRRFLEINSRLKEIESSFQLVTQSLQNQMGQGMIAQSKPMKIVSEMIRKVALSDSTSVLITGESGTGKELVARAIHYLSPRKQHYFYAVNSSAITETLFESEFFGHTKGSFTGASDNKTGWFEVANKGTLFLDEIGDLPLGLQTKFLRVLEERKINRVGAHKEIDIDVRIVAATNQDLEKLTEEKKFRLDLYHRLNSFVITLPPLRERRDDIPLLLNYFADEIAKKLNKKIEYIEDDVVQALTSYHFPGNIRELRNMVERAVILSEKGKLRMNDFQLEKIGRKASAPEADTEILNLERLERNAIIRAIHRAKYNKSAAARLLNISFQSLDRRIKKHNIVFERRLT